MLEERFDDDEPISSQKIQFRLIDFGELLNYTDQPTKGVIEKIEMLVGTPETV